MQATRTNATTDPTTHRPRTPEELLDREEALALQRIALATERFGDDVCEAARLRERIREHPRIAVALGGVLGFLCGPATLRLLTRMPGLLARDSSGASKLVGWIHPLGDRLLAALRTLDSRA